MTNDELVNTIRILQSEIEVQKSRIQPHDTGHIHTTIGVLEDRVEELLNEVKTGVNKKEAEEIKAKLEAAGAKVELK